MSWTVYILACADGTLYTGITNRLEHRVAQHGAGKGARYTRSRLPVTLAHSEEVPDRSAALKREVEIKALDRRAKLALCSIPKKRRRKAVRGFRRRSE